MSATDTGPSLGLLQAVAIEVGPIVGGALFRLTGVAVGRTGPGVVVAFTLAFGIAILGLVPTAMLGAAFRRSALETRYEETGAGVYDPVF